MVEGMEAGSSDPASSIDVGDYCRRVEEHLTKVNGGHLVRVVGPAFELVRRWANDGVPLSVVFRGIERKAERRATSRPGRPLRLEFCEGDVGAVFEGWCRAVGVGSHAEATEDTETTEPSGSKRKPSLSKHVERAVDRLSRAMGRDDWPESLRADAERLLVALAGIRESARTARGPARGELTERFRGLDADIAAAAAASASPALLTELRSEAEQELAPFRGRLPGEAWRQSIAVVVDRLLRDRLGLPALAP
jgi:hypothetical protein